MAQPERGPAGTKKRWREAALGGALVALGGALFGATRRAAEPGGKPGAGATAKGRGAGQEPGKAGTNKGGAKPDPRSRPNVSKSKVRTKPNPPAAVGPTLYWPPPPPKPLDVYSDGVRPPEQAVQNSHLPVDPGAEKRGYEGFDAKPGTIVKVMLSSVVVIVCCIAGLFYLIGQQHREDARGPALTPQQLAVIVPPGPHLQDHPLHDIATENKREFDLLKYYAWTGPDHRAGRIPIERAQALVTGRPLDPLPSAAPQAPGGPAAAPTAPAPVPASNP
ncbi:hypothetical protein D3273_07995 [Lichenibacterium minor]|uniref:Uncharacterized protein n=1 Tax=Lichenibacterium minor TaxID=2316528 RepID=A0A4Q2UBV6_9HYPH|nr:hypothetical protein [Lichenibacterium minor]RYC32657.1 hypothetical protein D3273_07995 [Lichenibacterium minor]